MSYEVLSKDLYEEKEDSGKSKKKGSKKFNFNPLYIHGLFLIIIFVILLFYFISPSSDGKEKLGNLDLTGEIENFNKSYIGNLSFYSGEFILETKDTFKGKSKDFEVEDFSGRIYMENRTIVFFGTASKIKYDDNNINLENTNFKLISKRKTNFKGYFEELDLFVLDGKLKIDSSLTHNFVNSNITISKINASINYDGIFSISGIAKKIDFKSKEQKLNIAFENE